MFVKHGTTPAVPMLDGIARRTIAFGGRTLMTEFILEGGRTLPAHAHPYEQTGYLVSGRIRLRIGDETMLMEPGDSWCIPEDVEHGAEIVEDAVAVEVFSPVRMDYLPAAD